MNKSILLGLLFVCVFVVALNTMMKKEILDATKKTITQSKQLDSIRQFSHKEVGRVLTIIDGIYLIEHCKDTTISIDSVYGVVQTNFRRTIQKNKKTLGPTYNSVYINYCANCHDTGIMGAPNKPPNKPFDILFNHVWNGYEGEYGEMPVKGDCFDCDSLDIESAIKFFQTKI